MGLEETKTVKQQTLSQSGATKRCYTDMVVWLDLAIFQNYLKLVCCVSNSGPWLPQHVNLASESAWLYMQHCPLVTWTCNCISRRPSYRKVWPLVEVQLRVVSRCDADLSLKALFSYGKYGRGTLVLILANGLWCLSEQVLQWHGETAEN